VYFPGVVHTCVQRSHGLGGRPGSRANPLISLIGSAINLSREYDRKWLLALELQYSSGFAVIAGRETLGANRTPFIGETTE
jgi:hypothetical protein